jgi:antirestriction protein ArdC
MVRIDTGHRDLRAEVTDTIVKMMEQGTAPWQKPWKSGAPAPFEMPFNPTTARRYQGGNALYLMAVGSKRGYEDSRWMTYKQATEQGWQVRRGEKASYVEFWQFPDASRDVSASKSTEKSTEGQTLSPRGPIHRVYAVFNAEQIEGIPKRVQAVHQDWVSVQVGERILENSGAAIRHDKNDRAFYDLKTDTIHLPSPGSFENAAGYYGTALHELSHWSGHSSRLNRETLTDPSRFGGQAYAREELRAELASVFLAAERGIPYNPEQNAAYLDSWIKALRNDKNEIFRAAHDAHKAADFLLALDRGLNPEEALQATRNIADQDKSGLKTLSPGQIQPEVLVLAPATLTEPRRETTDWVAQYEPGSQTVDITEKDNATEHRAVTPAAGKESEPDHLGDANLAQEQILDDQVQGKLPVSEQEIAASFHHAEEITKSRLGAEAVTAPAAKDSGIYRGEILGDTEHHVVQGITAHIAVAHEKGLLDTLPAVGEQVRIAYSNSLAQVNPFHLHMRAKALSR